MNDDMHPDDPLAAALRALPEEREPARDLWPEVADRISRRRRQLRARTVVGVAAFLAAASFALLVGPLGGESPLASPGTESSSGSGGQAEDPAISRLAQVSSGGMGGSGTGGSGGNRNRNRNGMMMAGSGGSTRLEVSAGAGPPASTWR